MMKPISRRVMFPKWPNGKRKNSLITTNSILAGNTFRYQRKKIIGSYKEYLKGWVFERNTLEPMESGTIEFTIIRHNHKKIDPDSIGATVSKWIIDTLVELGWFRDDDKLKIIYNPPKYEDGLPESMIDIKIDFEEIK